MPFEVSEQDILKELEESGASVSEENVILEMRRLCLYFRQSADDLVSCWISFASNSGLDYSNPTLDGLSQFERESLTKKTSKSAKSSMSTSSSLIPPVYNAKTIDNVESMMDCYETPKRKGTSRRITDSQDSPRIIFSPNSYSPSSAKYSSRGGKGDVLCSFGDSSVVDQSGRSDAHIQVSCLDKEQMLKNTYQYMFEKLRDRCGVLNDMIEDMAQILQEKHKVEEWGHVRIPHLDEVSVIGRICCDCNGKLNATSVLLEGSLESSSGQVVPVDLSSLPQYAIFPGQILAARAVNIEGTRLIMKSLLEGENPKFPEDLPNFGPGFLDIVVAAGPFTTSDSLTFEPLSDLLNYVQNHNPHVLILIGPFVDIKHESVQKGDLNESYDQLFKNQIDSVLNFLAGRSTSLILVPSLRDIHHHGIYPTPPFELNKMTKEVSVFCASDPCMLNVGGLIVGITSVDVLFHLGKEEISHPPGLSDRLGRLASHLLNQHSFYPLYPPSENVNIDYEHMEVYGKMSVCPHILITPSDLRYFVKDIQGCCCVNTERLAKGLCGGSFARIRVKSCEENQKSGSVIENIHVDIIRI